MKEMQSSAAAASVELLLQRLYWLDKLSGALPEGALFLESVKPARHANAFERHTFELPPEVSERVLKLAKNSDLATYLVLVAALKILIPRYTGDDDVMVGSPVYKPDFEVDSTNAVVPLRSRVSSDLTFKEYLLQVKQTVLEAYSNQNYPFKMVAELLNLPSRNGWFPVLDIVILLENLHDKNIVRDIGNALTFSFATAGSEIICNAKYNAALFERAAIERFATHYTNILRCGSQNIDSRISEISALTEAEEHQLLVQFNRTSTLAEDDIAVNRLFEEQVKKTPERIAVKSNGQNYTYRQLNDGANRVAHRLKSSGVGPESLVAVIAERGFTLLTAVLAIFKAGGVYLPVDPLLPPRRLLQVLQQSHTALVLAGADLPAQITIALEGMPSPQRPEVVVFEDLLQQDRPHHDLPDLCAPHQLAYVIYTSGSTGVPKGAMVEHRGMLNHLRAKIADLGLTESDIVAQTASQSFDISVWQLLAPLLVGGQVQIVSTEVAQDPSALLKMAELERVTILEIVPSLLRAMLEEVGDSKTARFELGNLSWMMVTGEALMAEPCRQWLKRFPQARMVNAYGPTECSDDVTHHFITDQPALEELHLPIGKALANCRLYILDRELRPVPVGIAGELFVGGAGVGRGYLNDEEQTAEVFVPDRFGQEVGGRLYKTGDLACYREDGVIEFLGRIDQQVKMRGYRIELGEIEAVLSQHPSLTDAAVLALEDATGDKRLMAYVVSSDGSDAIRRQIREYMQDRLPEYMVPSAFVMMDALPLTPNGKVDRRTLALRGFTSTDSESADVLSRTPVEEIVAGILAGVLRLEEVGVNRDFFEMGGHSLLATQVVSRVREVLGVEVPLRALFKNPTVAGLAEAVEWELRADSRVEAPPIVPMSRQGELPLSFAQQRLWFIQQLDPQSVAYNAPLAVRLQGELHVSALRQSLAEIMRRHEVLRTRFTSRQGRPVQVIDEPCEIELPVWDLSGLEQREREQRAQVVVARDTQRPFDLEREPVWRVALVQLGAGSNVLLLNMHHVAGDGWSLGVLIKEITMLYECFREGRSSTLPELMVQYADYALWQREWLQGEVLEEQLQYWRQHLSGASALKLRTDQRRAETTERLEGEVSFVLSPELTRAVKELSRREGVTLFMTLLAVYQIVLGRYADQEDVVVGTDVANRNRLETEEMIGFFVNQLVLRVKLEGRLTFRELLERVREVTLAAYAHQDLPFEKLVEELAEARDPSRTQLFEASLVFQNVPEQRVNLPMFKLELFPTGPRAAKFNLALRVEESERGLVGALSYATNVIYRADAELLAAQMEELFAMVTAQCDLSLDALRAKLDEFVARYRAAKKASIKGAFEARLSGRRQPYSQAAN